MRNFIVAAGLLGAALTAPPAANAQIVSPVTVMASGFRHGFCMDIRAGGNDALLWPCHGAANQQFHFVTGSYGQIQDGNGRCLSTSGGAGASLVAVPCQNVPAQRWALQPNGRLNNEQGWCADVEGGGGQGARVIAWHCNNQGNQTWSLSQFQYGQTQVAGGGIVCDGSQCLPSDNPLQTCLRDPQRCFAIRPVYGLQSLR